MFCALAKYATVMIVGDSLSWEHYVSLAQLLRVRSVYGYMHLCGGTSRLVYRRDDHLTDIRHALFENLTHIPQVLVLNRGAHYVKDGQYRRELRSTLDVVEEWLGRCDQLKIKCHFFWRTTVPGHVNCRSFKAPVNDKAAMEAHIADLSQYVGSALDFHWYDFQHRNLLAEAELKRRRHNLTYQILDGYHINVLRPDKHTDCLHSCCPGKMDVYPQLMLHYLRGDRTAADVESLRSVFHEHQWNINVTTNIKKTSRTKEDEWLLQTAHHLVN
jgi:GDSL/SGNH-like Acyl-Esterase family found in Pmr5 and Cas1p